MISGNPAAEIFTSWQYAQPGKTARVLPLRATLDGYLKFDSTGTAYDLSVQAPPFALKDFKAASADARSIS